MKIEDAKQLLASAGFEEVGRVAYGGVAVGHFWNPDPAVEVCVAQTANAGALLLKAQMHYFMRAVQDDQEILGRDLEPFIRACESVFPELHMQFSVFRDLPDEALARRIRELHPKGAANPAALDQSREELSQTLDEIENQRETLASAERVARHVGNDGLAGSYLRTRTQRTRRDIKDLEGKARALGQSIEKGLKLIKAYRKEGRGAAALFCAVSTIHVVVDLAEFSDAFRTAVKEITDTDKYVIRAKLGGSLKVFVEPLRHPALAYMAEFAGGVPSLTQLAAAGEEFKPISDAACSCTMVTPGRDILIDGALKDTRKSLGPRLLKSVVSRVDRVRTPPSDSRQDHVQMPAFLGKLVGTEDRFVVGLEDLGHFAIVGPTGCGKTFMARVLVEEAVKNNIAVVVIDPRDQWAGMALPEDRPSVLKRYVDFDMGTDEATGYPIAYYASGDATGLPLPTDLARLAVPGTISVVSVQALDDQEGCTLLGDILQGVFDGCCAQGESPVPRVWHLIEEFHNFVPSKVADKAKPQARRTMSIFDTLRREGRKFGCFSGFVSTSFHDAGGTIASASRLNTTSLVAFKTHDLDLKYLASFIEPKHLENLGPYEAYLCCPQGNYGFVPRPPYSKVMHVPGDVRKILFGQPGPSPGDLTEEEARIVTAAASHYAETGEYPNVAAIMKITGITSKGKLQSLLQDLERKGYVRTQKLTGQRGSPRIVIPLVDASDAKEEDRT